MSGPRDGCVTIIKANRSPKIWTVATKLQNTGLDRGAWYNHAQNRF